MTREFVISNKERVASILSNIIIAFLFLIPGYFVVVYSQRDSISKAYFYIFNILNVLEILLFISISILNVITKYSTLRSIIFVKSVISFIVYAVIVMFILVAI